MSRLPPAVPLLYCYLSVFRNLIRVFRGPPGHTFVPFPRVLAKVLSAVSKQTTLLLGDAYPNLFYPSWSRTLKIELLF